MKRLFLTTVLISAFIFTIAQKNSKSLHSDSLDVLNYTIEMDFSQMSSSPDIFGIATLQIVPKVDDLDVVSLDLLQLTVDSIFFAGVPAPSFSYNDTLLNIQTPSLYQTTDTFFVTVHYHGDPQVDPSGWGGFYMSSSYAYNLGVGFEDNPHNYGRPWHPCIDDFIDRATYDLYIKCPNPKIAVCGGYLNSVTDHGDGTATHHWVMDKEIPTYLASVAVGEYVLVTDTLYGAYGDVPIDIYVYPGDSVNAVNSFVNLKATVEAFEEYFGPYAWNRVGYVATGVGAMEHATNIAYPYFCIDGSLSYETLAAHELGHMWFGDLVTCETAEDMWINEGWGVFCEYMFMEAIYGVQSRKDYIRGTHLRNLRYLHIEEDSWQALSGIPHDLTYGTTVYQKGATVTHSLRGYLGDDTFFDAVRSYTSDLAFSDVSSEEFRDYLTTETGVDMTDWFDSWIFNPGYVHFSIDSFNVLSYGVPFEVEVFMKQKLRGPALMSNSCRTEINFMDADWNIYSDTIMWDGETGSQIFEVPFLPQIVMCDMEEKIMDATTDLYMTLDEVDQYDYMDAYMRIDVNEIVDSAFVRVVHNFAAPDTLDPVVPGLFISNNRYWTVDGIKPSTFAANGRFYYNKSTSANNGYLDNELVTNHIDSLVLLYRPGAGHAWDTVGFIRGGNSYYGYMISDELLFGEYTFGMRDWDLWVGTTEFEIEDDEFKVYPNPSNGSFTIELTESMKGMIRIYDLSGREVDIIPVEEGVEKLIWNPEDQQQGTYILHFFNGEKVFTKKLIRN